MSEEQPAAKRPKIRLACQECRDRKIRCDGGRPICNSCSRKRSGRCIYTEPGNGTDAEYVKSLENRIRTLEQGLSQPTATQEDYRLRHPQPIHLSSAETLATLRYGPGNHAPTIAPAPNLNVNLAPRKASPRPLEPHGQLLPVLSQDASSSSTIGAENIAAVMPMVASSRTLENPSSNHVPYLRKDSHQDQDHPSNPSSSPMRQPSVQTSWHAGQEKDISRQPESNSGVDDDVPNPQERSTMGTVGIVEGAPGTMNDSSVYLGLSSAAAFIHEIRVQSPKRRRENESTNSPRAEHERRAAISTAYESSRRRQAYDQEMTSLMQQIVLPPRQFADAHLQSYWSYFYPFNPILHRKTFQRRYEDIWSNSMSINGSRAASGDEADDIGYTCAFHALVNILVALGSLYTDVSNERPSAEHSVTTTGHIFYERAESLITRKSMSHSNLLSVQVFILMAQYLQTTGLVNKCWITVGTAIRVAQGLGIHLDRASESQAQQQERRRTWAYCVQMDRILAMIFGRPPMVTWPSKDPPPDLTDDDLLLTEPYSCAEPTSKVERSVLGFFVHSVRFSEILLEVLRVLYTQPPVRDKESHSRQFHIDDYHQLFALDADLAQWRSQLPDSLVVQPDGELLGNSVFRTQAISILCRYLHLKILLFRPATVEATKSTLCTTFGTDSRHPALTELQRHMFIGCVHSCVVAAQNLIKVIHVRCMGSLQRLPNWWYTTFYIFTASTALLAVILSPDVQSLLPPTIDPLETTWKKAIEVLALYEKRGCKFAEQCARTLHTALNQGLRDLRTHSRGSVPADTNRETHTDDGHSASWSGQKRAAFPIPDNEMSDGSSGNERSGDYWWQMAGLNWLDFIDHSGDFLVDS